MVGGVRVPYTYRGDPSFGDDAMARRIRAGYPQLAGYIIDADKITRFNGDDTAGSLQSSPRCGY
jgi:hypothetical protein